MKLGVALRSMGPQATAATLLACARAAEAAGLDDVWVQDHVAIPPDDAEGSNGRYLDPLTTLAWLAAGTARIGLGTGVLILPYRPPLPTAKAVATVQELSGGRLLLGVGVGWMEPEFRALGLSRAERGRRSDETLAFLRDCFEAEGDVAVAHGQPFLFRPNPPRPPIYVGGHGRHALARVVRHGDGWFPMGARPDALREPVATLRAMAAEAGRPPPEVVTFTAFDAGAPGRVADQLSALAEAGVTRLVAGGRYEDAAAFERQAAFLGEHVVPIARGLR